MFAAMREKSSSQDSIQNAWISSKLKYVAHLYYNFQSVEDHLTLSLIWGIQISEALGWFIRFRLPMAKVFSYAIQCFFFSFFFNTMKAAPHPLPYCCILHLPNISSPSSDPFFVSILGVGATQQYQRLTWSTDRPAPWPLLSIVNLGYNFVIAKVYCRILCNTPNSV